MTIELSKYFEGQPDIVDKNLEISLFGLQVKCAPWPFPDDFKIQYSNIFYQAIFDILSKAGIPKTGLNFTTPEKALQINKTRGEGSIGWFGMSYQVPGKDFGITVDDTVFQIRCEDIRLEDLVKLVDGVFSHITSAWLDDTLASPAQLLERAHTVEFSFQSNFRLGKDKVQQTPVPNYKLVREALSLDREPHSNGGLAISEALPVLGVDQIIRTDFTQYALKELDNHLYNMGIEIQGPFNENNSILALKSFIRMEDDFEFDLSAGLNWNTAFVSFYRELILKRLMANMFCSTEFSCV